MALGILSPEKVMADDNRSLDSADSIHVYLLTCSPHPEVYSLYGHTAIRIVDDRRKNFDYAINYGVFDYNKPFFVLRFVFGLTDYEMGIFSTILFKQEYLSYGSSVTEQEINLTAAEKQKFLELIDENNKEENRTYRYNYFYDNCTTRARDIIARSVSGKVNFPNEAPKEGTTFREMIHEMNVDYPWARLGNDLLLGVGADRQLTAEEREFLPHAMMSDADKSVIVNKQGVKRPFVLNKDELIEGDSQVVEKEFPLTPVQCACITLAVFLLITALEKRKKTYYWWFDSAMFLLQGLCGVIITAMVFSQHPTVSVNAQILVFNILPLLFGIQAIKGFTKGKRHWLWRTQMILICLMIVIYAFGIQWIDPSVLIISCCILLRCAMKELKTNE